MKKIIISFTLICYSQIALSQVRIIPEPSSAQSNLTELRQNLQAEVEFRDPDKNPENKPNDVKSFRSVFKKVFSTVVLGKTDAIANGSAFAYAQDNNKGVFSINGTRMPKKWENTLFDGGISIKNKDNNYSYYQKGSWSSDITFKIGMAIKITPKKGYYNPQAAREANKARAAFFDKEYQKYSQLINNDHITQDATRLAEMRNELNNVSTLTRKIIDAYGQTDDATKPYHGYRIAWMNINASYTNSSFTIANDSVMTDAVQEKFSSISKGTLETNFNFHLKGITHFYIAQVYGRFNRVSILDNVDLIDKKIKVSPSPVDGTYSLYYYDSATATVNHFGTYSQIHRPVLMVDYGAYFAYLMPFKQRLGINARVNFTTPYGDNDYNFKRSYSVLVGPIVRLDKDKLFSAATFTLNFGFENAKYTENAWDKFIIKASAAIPFNVFEKTK